ncbi:MATE family efflux transporter [Candidatus Epulonipiscium fishelsonii]|uniref:MATE family efflux transporter n=1 Tax=Candidatus Epulonipiscium fishelsonii TaxID=77094 RepID=A0ACC8XCG0_9FIRM|nr:MATE family efflux transporter [Epulopiscium sp. SCG-B11WGA-EpuloA1]ONI42732.1 MATE family efflux transporter [Epulopiscium sp. SCG-B05WGA-EpuloA1]
MMIIKEKAFYKSLISIALPIAIQNLIGTAVSIADTVMLGQLGEVELSAAAISSHLFFIFLVVNFGIAGGSNVLISQYYGKGDIPSIHKILCQMYKLSAIISLVFSSIAILIPEVFLSIFTTDLEVTATGVPYLRIVGAGYIFYSITNCTVLAYRSVQSVKISMVIYSVSLVVNILFNYIFIFGKFGAPELGVIGAAIATLIARITEFIIVIIYLKYFDKKIRINRNTFRKVDAVMKKDYIKTTTPVIINEFIWSMGSASISIIIGRLGTEIVAANSISNVVSQFMTIFVYALSSSTSVIIGNSIGEENYKRTKEIAVTILLCVTALGIASGILVYNIRGFVVDFYNVTDSTKSIAMTIMGINSFIIVFQVLANTILVGMLRAGGDSKFVLVNDVIFMWCIAIPFGFLAAFLWQLPIFLVFIIIRIDEILKVLVSLIRLLRFKWINNLTR